MSEQLTIQSLQNPLVKEILSLKEKSRLRRKSGLFVLEGRREVELALEGGYELRTLVHCAELQAEPLSYPTTREVWVSRQVYERLAHRGSTEGILAIAYAKVHLLESLPNTTENPLYLIAEAPEKPGNIGALLRTADAAGLDGVIIANPRTDLYNPNIIRSSVGCLFTTRVATGSTEEILEFLADRGIALWAAALSASVPYHEVDYTGAGAIAVGTEADGLSEAWLQAADQNVIIPMSGQIDSMNVSVSAAILIFEAKRQRGFAS